MGPLAPTCCGSKDSHRVVMLNSKYETDLTNSSKIVEAPNFDGKYNRRTASPTKASFKYSANQSVNRGVSLWNDLG